MVLYASEDHVFELSLKLGKLEIYFEIKEAGSFVSCVTPETQA